MQEGDIKGGQMKKDKHINPKEEAVCCSEEKMLCEPCSFEDSVKVED